MKMKEVIRLATLVSLSGKVWWSWQSGGPSSPRGTLIGWGWTGQGRNREGCPVAIGPVW